MCKKYLTIFVKHFCDSCTISFEGIEAVSKAEAEGKAVARCREIKGSSLDKVDYKIITKNELIKKLLD